MEGIEDKTLLKTKDKEPLVEMILKECLNQFKKCETISNPKNNKVKDFLKSRYDGLLKNIDIITIQNLILIYSKQYFTIYDIKPVSKISYKIRNNIFLSIQGEEKVYFEDLQRQLDQISQIS